MQIKIMMTYHYTPIWRVKNLTIWSTRKNAEQVELSFIIDRNVKWYCTLENSLAVLSYDAETFLSVYPDKVNPDAYLT
jgi:hypothetical protein